MHETIRVALSTGPAEVDVGLVDLIVELDRADLRTDACCERAHIFLGGATIESDQPYIALSEGAHLRTFIEESSRVIPHEPVSSELSTLVDRSNGHETG